MIIDQVFNIIILELFKNNALHYYAERKKIRKVDILT